MRQSNRDTLSDVIVHEERYAYTPGKEVLRGGRGEEKKCVWCSQQHKFNNKNRIVCVWEAGLVKAVSLNLTHPYPHVIPFSLALPACVHRQTISSVLLIIMSNLHLRQSNNSPAKMAPPATASRLKRYFHFAFPTYLWPWRWQEGVAVWEEQKRSWH